MTNGSEGGAGVPRKVESAQLSDVNLNAEEGFVWSRVDGVVGVDEICMMTGLGKDEITGIFEDLEVLGLVSWRGGNGGQPARSIATGRDPRTQSTTYRDVHP